MVNCMKTSVFLPVIYTTLQIIKLVFLNSYNCAWMVAFLKSNHRYGHWILHCHGINATHVDGNPGVCQVLINYGYPWVR